MNLEQFNYIEFEDGRVIKYIINKGKRKNIYISIQDGNVIVKTPKCISESKIHEIVMSKSKWIYKKLLLVNEKANSKKQFVNGEIFRILGKDYILAIVFNYEKAFNVEKDNEKLYVYLPNTYLNIERIKVENEIKKLVEDYYLKLANEEVRYAMNVVTNEVGISPNKYRVRNLKRAWGNCSSTRNITINVNLVKYSKEAIRYVVLHEVCHLKYMNHSKEFWNLVKYYMEDYKKIQEELKK